tara:strand:- start:13628 stop:14116 length:489 start_codon:yes stop_codon:yes gene_type:complete
MAVPSKGTLTMLGLARERKVGNYYSSVTLFYPILMSDLINGGGQNSFPALNVNSPSKPNTLKPFSMSEWYSYDQDYAPPAECELVTLRFTRKFRSGEEACTAEESLFLYTSNPKNWFAVPLYAEEGCKEGTYAASGAYSDRQGWGVWDGISGTWTSVGLCRF